MFLLDVGTGQPIRKLRGHLSVRFQSVTTESLLSSSMIFNIISLLFLQRINCVKFNEESTMILTGMHECTCILFYGISTALCNWVAVPRPLLSLEFDHFQYHGVQLIHL